ncbi:DUF3105 domain-containing protein [Natronomonas sp. EA1]|uniref:DUF3105 domain-containing protein n=1 Tax=Natronomonas sp. EA1 TaxID=3421655 RepID=UPI003EB7362C
MVECDYCGAAFDDEDSYLDHLREEHLEDLGPIDKRRVSGGASEESSFPTGPVVLGAVLLAAAAIVMYVVFLPGGGGEVGGIEGEPLPENGDPAVIQEVQTFPNEGNQHVEAGTEIEWDTSPPTSGPHYSTTVGAGFYTEPQPLGAVVHTLEHGGVVIYYDPAALTPEAEESLRAYAQVHTDTWASVVVMPYPEGTDTGGAAYTLTAWRHMYRMDEYDAETVRAFLAEYLGRGPENPVR